MAAGSQAGDASGFQKDSKIILTISLNNDIFSINFPDFIRQILSRLFFEKERYDE